MNHPVVAGFSACDTERANLREGLSNVAMWNIAYIYKLFFLIETVFLLMFFTVLIVIVVKYLLLLLLAIVFLVIFSVLFLGSNCHVTQSPQSDGWSMGNVCRQVS